MERKEVKVNPMRRISKNPVLYFLAVLLFFVGNGWASCTTYNTYFYASGTKTCGDNVCTLNQIQFLDFQCASGSVTAPKGSCGNGNAIKVNYQCNGSSTRPYIVSISYDKCQGYGDYIYYDRIPRTATV